MKIQKQYEQVKHLLGKHVEDIVTKVEGMCTMVCIQSDGQLRIEITPIASGPKPEEAHFYDLAQVREKNHNPISDFYREPLPTVEPADFSELKWMDYYKCILTGYKGRLNQICIYVNGCVHLSLVSGFNKKDGTNISKWVPYQHLAIELQEKPREHVKTPPGGPITKSPPRI